MTMFCFLCDTWPSISITLPNPTTDIRLNGLMYIRKKEPCLELDDTEMLSSFTATGRETNICRQVTIPRVNHWTYQVEFIQFISDPC